jgi:hypothetical protein
MPGRTWQIDIVAVRVERPKSSLATLVGTPEVSMTDAAAWQVAEAEPSSFHAVARRRRS